MNMVLKQLMDFLIEHGVQPIDAIGQTFDPNLHEAIAHEPNDEVPENVIIRQSRRGYRMKDRLLRPSSVVVSSGPGSSGSLCPFEPSREISQRSHSMLATFR
jgi:molecular chaperone GrpE